jgi:hypothetical protein
MSGSRPKTSPDLYQAAKSSVCVDPDLFSAQVTFQTYFKPGSRHQNNALVLRRSGLVLNTMMVTIDDHHTQSDQYDGHDLRPSYVLKTSPDLDQGQEQVRSRAKTGPGQTKNKSGLEQKQVRIRPKTSPDLDQKQVRV